MATNPNLDFLTQLAEALVTVVVPLNNAASGTSGTSGASGTSNASTPKAFCGTEDRISDKSCNSLHPAVTFDASGNIAVVWHDTRDGNYEIYMRVLQSMLSPQQLVSDGFTFDPVTGRPVNLNCSAFSAATNLSQVCGFSGSSNTGNKTLITQGGGRLDVNPVSRVAVLTATQGSFDFDQLGVGANSKVTIVNGLNAGQVFLVSSIVSPTILNLAFADLMQSDNGFVYSVSAPDTTLQTCEARLTCNQSASIFPDIVCDSQGRFHVVYQDNATGNFELYYIQVYPSNIGPKKCNTGFPISSAGFGTVLDGTPGSIVINPNTKFAQSETKSASSTFLPTGSTGTFFSFGDKLLPDPIPSQSGPLLLRTGVHKLFRNFYPGAGAWTGVSAAADRTLWQQQATVDGLTVEPDYIAPANHPIAGEGDFGTTLSFPNVAFIAQSPPDKSVNITRVGLPLKPRCVPTAPSDIPPIRTQDLIPAPKKPVPPSFTDPIDLSTFLTSPLTQLDQTVPPRFTIDGDTSGTVFTNILTDNGRGQLSRLVFTCDGAGQCQKPDDIRFILSQRQCGTEFCAASPAPTGSSPTDTAPSGQYDIRMQVWVGPDYRGDPLQIANGFMNASKLIDRTFTLDPGEDVTNFDFKDGELIVPDGRYIFFVPIAGSNTEFFVQGTGNGHNVWSTDGSGRFDQYYVPFTVSPNTGMSAPVYYEGYLAGAGSGTTVTPTDPGNDPTSLAQCLAKTPDQVVPLFFAETEASGFFPLGSPTGNSMAQGFIIGNATVLQSVEFVVDPSTAGALMQGQIVPASASGVPNGPAIASVSAEAASTGFATFGFCVNLAPGNYALVISTSTAVNVGDHFPGTAEPQPTAFFGAVFNGEEGLPLDGWSATSGGSLFLRANFNYLNQLPAVPNSGIPSSGSTPKFAQTEPVASAGTSSAPGGDLVATSPLQLTNSNGDSVHPRMAIDKHDNIWLVFHSNRSGSDEAYVARYFGGCGQWATATSGGTEFKLTNAGVHAGVAQFPNVAVDELGEAHIVYQSTNTEDKHPEIFYARTTSGGTEYLHPLRLTTSPGSALMPDITITSNTTLSNTASCDKLSGSATSDEGSGKIFVAWHDNRYGNFEILSATKLNGIWISSGQGSADVRLTQAPGDSLFPRLTSDNKANVRVVYHDYRRGLDNPWIYMSTFVALAAVWDASGQGGVDIPVTPTGSADSLFPDIATDASASVFVTWHDTRFQASSPEQHEVIMGNYCPKLGTPIPCFSPICSNLENFLATSFDIVDCVLDNAIQVTNVPEVCLKITSPGATFYRAANEDGNFSPWTPFAPTTDLDTMVVPWTLSCGNGSKQVCVQIQDASSVGFPVCQNVTLQSAPPTFKIEFFADRKLQRALPTFKGHSVAPEGDVYVKLTSSTPMVRPPTFDVVSKGTHLVFNQQTEPFGASGVSGFSSTKGSFVGNDVATTANGTSGTAFSAFASSVFIGRFHVHHDDGFFHIDGQARLIPHGTTLGGQSF